MNTGFVLIGSFRFVPETGEYAGVVVKQNNDGKMEVLAIGAEDSELAIMEWLKTTVALMRTQARLDVQAADKYDRLRNPNNMH